MKSLTIIYPDHLFGHLEETALNLQVQGFLTSVSQETGTLVIREKAESPDIEDIYPDEEIEELRRRGFVITAS